MARLIYDGCPKKPEATSIQRLKVTFYMERGPGITRIDETFNTVDALQKAFQLSKGIKVLRIEELEPDEKIC